MTSREHTWPYVSLTSVLRCDMMCCLCKCNQLVLWQHKGIAQTKNKMNDDFYPTASNLFAKNKQLTDFILPEIESGCRVAGGSFPAGRFRDSHGISKLHQIQLILPYKAGYIRGSLEILLISLGRLCSSCAKYCPESDTGALNHSQMVWTILRTPISTPFSLSSNNCGLY